MTNPGMGAYETPRGKQPRTTTPDARPYSSSPSSAQSSAQSDPRRQRPPTTQEHRASQVDDPNRTMVHGPAGTSKMPGAAVTRAMTGKQTIPHFAGGFDQSQLYAHTAAQQTPSSTVQLHEQGLRSTDSRLFLINKPDSPQAAAFRVLRHQVEIEDAQGRLPQVIAVSSPTEGAGKSTTAANLALALAECGRAGVLLVEANFRRPTLARMFGYNPDHGFAGQLENYHTSPSSRWHLDSFASCHLHVAALSRGRKGMPLVDGPAFRHAIAGLRSANYQHIVIDCPSVLAGADVNLIQDSADGIVLVARAKKTTTRQIRDSIERLTPSRILGTILLGA